MIHKDLAAERRTNFGLAFKCMLQLLIKTSLDVIITMQKVDNLPSGALQTGFKVFRVSHVLWLLVERDPAPTYLCHHFGWIV
jgi:hypothetical protein